MLKKVDRRGSGRFAESNQWADFEAIGCGEHVHGQSLSYS